MSAQNFIEVSKSFFVDTDYKTALDELGLVSIDGVFSFDAGKNLSKANLSAYRSRMEIEISSPPKTLFLKRYDRPPVGVQIKNWLCHRSRVSCGLSNHQPASELDAMGVGTPKTICYGEQWVGLFEKRSFIISEKIPNAESLERKLPDCFCDAATAENLKLRRGFITRLAAFVKKFHDTGYRHRDLYLCHIFYDGEQRFWLIDLARAFRPIVFGQRFRIKDIAQIYYSAPGRYFSSTDRLRFYLEYVGHDKLCAADKAFIRKVINKARRIAKHDVKHGKEVPFMN